MLSYVVILTPFFCHSTNSSRTQQHNWKGLSTCPIVTPIDIPHPLETLPIPHRLTGLTSQEITVSILRRSDANCFSDPYETRLVKVFKPANRARMDQDDDHHIQANRSQSTLGQPDRKKGFESWRRQLKSQRSVGTFTPVLGT